MKKVMITGATSMIGIALIEECLKKHIYVIAMIRKNSLKINRLPKSKYIEIIECDINELNNLKKLNNITCDVFYHLAWEGTTKEERNNIILQEKNIKISLVAVELAKKLKCHTFIGAGSQAQYGRVELEKISPTTIGNPETAYGIAKYSAYKLTKLYAKEIGIKHIWGNIFSVYGIWDGENTMIDSTITKILKGEKTSFTKGEQLWDYLYSEDAGRAFYLMGLKGKDQSVYCIGSGEVKPLYKYIEIISNKLSNKLKLGIGELDYPNNQVMNLCADIRTLTKDTGFIPKYKFEEGIEKTIEWKKNKGEL